MKRLWTDGRLFHGTVGILRPGEVLSDDALICSDPAEALAEAWRVTGESSGTPFLYEVTVIGCQRPTVISDVLIDGGLASRAAEIMQRRRSH